MRCGNGIQCNSSPHILGYVVKLPEPINKSSRSPVDPPQLLHPNPRKTSENGTAIIKAGEHKSVNKGDSSIESQRASNDPQLPQLIVAATANLVYMMTEGEL